MATSSLTTHSRPRPSKISRRAHGRRRSQLANSSTKRAPTHQVPKINLRAFSLTIVLAEESITILTLSGEHHRSVRTSIMITSKIYAKQRFQLNLLLTSWSLLRHSMHQQPSPAPKQSCPRTVNKGGKSKPRSNRALQIAGKRHQRRSLRSRRSCRLLTSTQRTSTTNELTWISCPRQRSGLTRKLWIQAISRTLLVKIIQTSSTTHVKTSNQWELKQWRIKVPLTRMMIGTDQKGANYLVHMILIWYCK